VGTRKTFCSYVASSFSHTICEGNVPLHAMKAYGEWRLNSRPAGFNPRGRAPGGGLCSGDGLREM